MPFSCVLALTLPPSLCYLPGPGNPLSGEGDWTLGEGILDTGLTYCPEMLSQALGRPSSQHLEDFSPTEIVFAGVSHIVIPLLSAGMLPPYLH